MKEISLHILDVAENGISAGADLIRIEVAEDLQSNILRIVIADNGGGIPPEQIDLAADPFYTSRSTRRVGLGLSLLDAAARQCGGGMSIESGQGSGTRVTAEFVHDHIDRAPIGDMAGTMAGLIMGNPDVEFDYLHRVDGREFRLSTQAVKQELGGRPVTDLKVFRRIMETLRSGEKRLNQGG